MEGLLGAARRLDRQSQMLVSAVIFAAAISAVVLVAGGGTASLVPWAAECLYWGDPAHMLGMEGCANGIADRVQAVVLLVALNLVMASPLFFSGVMRTRVSWLACVVTGVFAAVTILQLGLVLIPSVVLLGLAARTSALSAQGADMTPV